MDVWPSEAENELVCVRLASFSLSRLPSFLSQDLKEQEEIRDSALRLAQRNSELFERNATFLLRQQLLDRAGEHSSGDKKEKRRDPRRRDKGKEKAKPLEEVEQIKARCFQLWQEIEDKKKEIEDIEKQILNAHAPPSKEQQRAESVPVEAAISEIDAEVSFFHKIQFKF